jgi:hypothetical protein
METPRLDESGSHRLSEFSFKHSKADSLTRQDGESSTPRLTESATPQLAESESQRLAKSESQRLTKSESQHLAKSESRQLAESGSRFSITNISANLKPKLERLERYQCKRSMRNQFLQKPQKIRLIAMSL